MSRGSVLVISLILGLFSVGPALGVEVQATNNPPMTSDTWQTYRSERGGFSVDVPEAWTIEERLDERGGLIVTLMPSSGAGIAVTSKPGTSVDQHDTDLINTHCAP